MPEKEIRAQELGREESLRSRGGTIHNAPMSAKQSDQPDRLTTRDNAEFDQAEEKLRRKLLTRPPSDRANGSCETQPPCWKP